MQAVYLKNFRMGLATNSSSTHSLIYKNDGEVFKDLDIMDVDYYDRCTRTIAASKEAKIKYVLANIMYEDSLVEIMTAFYPQMKEYYPLIKEEMEDRKDDEYYTFGESKFGMYSRGQLYFSNNLEASVDYLREVIENDEIIIVGGSDEEDFVYDTCEDHIEHPTPSDVESVGKKRGCIYKNGNYWVGFGRTGERIGKGAPLHKRYKHSGWGKIRFVTSKNTEPIPEYPELIDLKITDMCEHGCPFCYAGSTKNGKHAEIKFLRQVIHMVTDDSPRTVEFSIGGGNILLYPELETLFKCIREKGHILNVTIKADDVDTVLNDPEKHKLFNDYVDGIGVSVLNTDDAKKACELHDAFKYKKGSDFEFFKGKHIAAHLIPEMLGADTVKDITETLTNGGRYIPVLFLGYKAMGRGIQGKVFNLSRKDLDKMFDTYVRVSVDTCFANRFAWYIDHSFSHKYTLTRNEGEYSMFIDGVDEKAYKSSYQLDKPYNMHIDYRTSEENPYYNVVEAFAFIRKDNGFKTYKDLNDHYWTRENG